MAGLRRDRARRIRLEREIFMRAMIEVVRMMIMRRTIFD